jgi:hypothetical protein
LAGEKLLFLKRSSYFEKGRPFAEKELLFAKRMIFLGKRTSFLKKERSFGRELLLFSKRSFFFRKVPAFRPDTVHSPPSRCPRPFLQTPCRKAWPIRRRLTPHAASMFAGSVVAQTSSLHQTQARGLRYTAGSSRYSGFSGGGDCLYLGH